MQGSNHQLKVPFSRRDLLDLGRIYFKREKFKCRAQTYYYGAIDLKDFGTMKCGNFLCFFDNNALKIRIFSRFWGRHGIEVYESKIGFLNHV